MFSKLLNKLGPGKSGNESPFKCLRLSFEPLDAIEKGLSERITRFVSIGEEPKLLVWLQNNSDVNGDYLYRPGRFSSPIFNVYFRNKQLDASAEKAVVFRDEFYSLIWLAAKAELATGELNAIHVLIRLGHVLQAVDKGVSLQGRGAAVPEWLLYVLSDLHFASGSYKSPRKWPARDTWDLQIVQRIVEEVDLPLCTVVSLIFECKDGFLSRDSLLQMTQGDESVDWLIKHEAIVLKVWKTLSVGGKQVIVSAISKNEQLAEVFLPLLIELAMDRAKYVRDMARSHLSLIRAAERQKRFAAILKEGGAEKVSVVQLLERDGSEASKALLEAKLEQNPGKALAAAIRSSLSRMTTVATSQRALPELPAIEVPQDQPLSNSVLDLMLENWHELRSKLQHAVDMEVAGNKAMKAKNIPHMSTRAQEAWTKFKVVDKARVRQMFDQINSPDDAPQFSSDECDIVTHENRVIRHPEVTLRYLLNIIHLNASSMDFWRKPEFQRWLRAQDDKSAVDLRVIAALMPGGKEGRRGVASAALREHYALRSPCELLKNDAIWPFFAEHPEFLDEAMELRPADERSYYRFEKSKALSVMNTFPQIPSQYIPSILGIAFGATKGNRLQAQDLAGKLSGIEDTIIAELESAKQDTRVLAAEWLERIQAKVAVPALSIQLKKEKSQIVCGVLLKVLETLGADISPFLSPTELLKEATAGLKKKLPADLSWFPLGQLPSVHWKGDGTVVAPEILQGWVVLAFKLKSPAQNSLIQRYLDLLKPKDAARFSSFILNQFVEEDTRRPSAEEAAVHAQAHVQQRFAYHQSKAQQYPEYAKTYEQCFEELRRDKATQYLGSAISAKGILALANRTPAHELATIVRVYLRDHSLRTAQISALIEVCVGSDDPLVIQLLLSIARRYGGGGIQKQALNIVADIAARNDWTQDQLADRTIPTAGYGEDGVLHIDYAGRLLTARLCADLKPELRNSEGKVVKLLPAARKKDDAASIKEAKRFWRESKIELAQVMQLQASRLYDSMCIGRLWPVTEWQAYLCRHPVMNRLVQRLVWLQTDENGLMINSFRPSEDGSLLNTDDDEIELLPDSFIQLAHGTLLNEPLQKAWLDHFKDYKVKPLFEQLNRVLPVLNDEQMKAVTIEDHQGWVSDAFTIRSHLSKLGYQRSGGGHGASFDYYYKQFSGSDICVYIYFSGNGLPEANVAAAVTCLKFEQLNSRSWADRRLAIGQVPPVLLAEGYGDYTSVAKTGRFHEAWQSKVGW